MCGTVRGPVTVATQHVWKGRANVGGLFGLLAKGAGAILGANVARETVARLGAEARPLVRSAVKAGLTAADQMQHWTAEAREQLSDIVEEVRAEQRG